MLIDKSCSTGDKMTRKYVEKVLADFVDNLSLSEDGIRISIVSFYDSSVSVLPLSADKKYLYQSIKFLSDSKNDSANCFLQPALSIVTNIIIDGWNEQPDSATTEPARIIVISDGLVSDQENAYQYAGRLENNEYVTISTILSSETGESSPSYLQGLASDSSQYFGKDYFNLINEILRESRNH